MYGRINAYQGHDGVGIVLSSSAVLLQGWLDVEVCDHVSTDQDEIALDDVLLIDEPECLAR